MGDMFSKQKRSEIMSHIKNKDTIIELKVRSYLHLSGYRFRVNDKRYVGKPDIVLPKYKTISFINGCFWHWHGCKYSVMPNLNIDYWAVKIQKNIERDNRNIRTLESEGWKGITIWEC